MVLRNLAVKADRAAAWVLFLTIMVYAFTGYGMTKGFVSRDLSANLHLGWLGAIGLAAFIVHTSWAIHLFFVRNNLWNRVTKILLPLFYLFLTAFFLWLHFFYAPEEAAKEYNQIGSNQIAVDSVPAGFAFNAESLAVYNGRNGQPAYVAVDGVVYDMSKEFRNGRHHGYAAGQDLSLYFHNEHPDSYLDGLTVVGSYQE